MSPDAAALPFDFPAEGEVDPADPLVRHVIHKAYGAVDFWTRALLPLAEMHLDHVYPRALGGPDNVFNLVPTTRAVNIGKSDTFNPAAFVPVLAIIRAVYGPRVMTALARARRLKAKRLCPDLCAVQALDLDALPIIPAQCRAARAMLGLRREDLALAAGIASATLADFEGEQRTPHPRTMAAIRATLEAAGAVFIPADDTGGPGVVAPSRSRKLAA